MSRIRILVVLSLLGLCLPGCSMLQWMQPHQLWKLNREPAMGGEEGYFSVPAEQ